MLTLLMVQLGGWWLPLLGLVGLNDPCPMVLVLPGMCQPHAAPCQGASQSHFTPRPLWGATPSFLIALVLVVFDTETRQTLQNELWLCWIHVVYLCFFLYLTPDEMVTCDNIGRRAKAFCFPLPVNEPSVSLLPVVCCPGYNTSDANICSSDFVVIV